MSVQNKSKQLRSTWVPNEIIVTTNHLLHLEFLRSNDQRAIWVFLKQIIAHQTYCNSLIKSTKKDDFSKKITCSYEVSRDTWKIIINDLGRDTIYPHNVALELSGDKITILTAIAKKCNAFYDTTPENLTCSCSYDQLTNSFYGRSEVPAPNGWETICMYQTKQHLIKCQKSK